MLRMLQVLNACTFSLSSVRISLFLPLFLSGVLALRQEEFKLRVRGGNVRDVASGKSY